MQRLERLRLLDPHQFAGLPLDIPNLDVRQDFKRRAKAVLQAPRARSNTAKPSRSATEKTNHAVRLAQRKCFQDDSFRFPGRHGQSARRRCAGQPQHSVRIARTRRTQLLTIRLRKTQSLPIRKAQKTFSQGEEKTTNTALRSKAKPLNASVLPTQDVLLTSALPLQTLSDPSASFSFPPRFVTLLRAKLYVYPAQRHQPVSQLPLRQHHAHRRERGPVFL